eukprot:2940469-Karenia_brevis.AAC.1
MHVTDADHIYRCEDCEIAFPTNQQLQLHRQRLLQHLMYKGKQKKCLVNLEACWSPMTIDQ